MLIALLILLGLTAGSFINALVWRLERQANETKTKRAMRSLRGKILKVFGKQPTDKYSIMRGRSMCPKCEKKLTAIELIPVLSWMVQKGRCRNCNKPISVQYPIVELVTALLFVSIYIRFGTETTGDVTTMVFWLISSVFLVALALYDIKWLILPNILVYPLIIISLVHIGVLSLISGDTFIIREAFYGALALGGTFTAIFYLSKAKWIGGGDVKLGYFIGLALGWQLSLLALFFASWAGLLLFAVLLVAKKVETRGSQIPFGPLLIAGTYFALFWGPELIDWYLALYGL